MRIFLLVAGLVSFSGCDSIFPQLTAGDPSTTTSTPDLGVVTITGKVCQLSDLRSPSSCTTMVANRIVTIAETGASTTTASDGSFTLSSAGIASTATMEVSSGIGSAATAVPTISVLSNGVLLAAEKSGVLLPSVDADTFSNIELDNGAAGDDTRGSVVSWIVSSTGAAVAGAVAARIPSAVGPLYDVNDDDELETGAQAGTFGTVAFLDLVPGIAALSIAPPATSGLSGDTFNLTVVAGAITVGALALP